ncbi:MAG: hypothetical protein QW270_08240 [Candidatus Bathyarchaeia archaeon]
MSLEDQLSSIESQYKKSYEMLYNIDAEPSKYGTLGYTSEAIKNILLLQRMIELLCEDVKKLRDEKTKFYVNRCIKNVINIHELIRDYVCENVDQEEFNEAFLSFMQVRSLMYQVIEDVRLIYALKLYPIEEKWL